MHFMYELSLKIQFLIIIIINIHAVILVVKYKRIRKITELKDLHLISMINFILKIKLDVIKKSTNIKRFSWQTHNNIFISCL